MPGTQYTKHKELAYMQLELAEEMWAGMQIQNAATWQECLAEARRIVIGTVDA